MFFIIKIFPSRIENIQLQIVHCSSIIPAFINESSISNLLDMQNAQVSILFRSIMILPLRE